MSPVDRALVGPLAWTPQQKAQYDVAFFRGLARDRQAQRVYLAGYSCVSGSDRMFTFCSLLSVTNSPERSCSPAAGRGAEPSPPRTGRVLLCAPLSAQLVAVRHRAVAALPKM